MAASNTPLRAELLFHGAWTLGEGARYDPETGHLWWVDILGKRLMRGRPETGETVFWDFETEIGAALPMTDGRRALVLRDRIEAFEPATGARAVIWRVPDEPASNRFNDAGIDPTGRLWAGSMDFNAEAESGALWRLDSDGTGTRTEHGYKVLNGPVFSPDGRTLYLGDTVAGRVLAFDLETGTLSNRRLFLQLGPHEGLADGMAVDAEGNVWLAQITAGRIGCYAPDGRHLRSIAVPVPSVTSCTFGGPEMKTLYITTARILLDDADLAAYPESGSVFAVETEAQGLPPNAFASGSDA